ncbi:RHS repeat-associated core domain-containing protein [Paraburkholderia fungorum]|uniref:RHS repeat-associated core domain-containing protein n=1 Tax=Paraburkholderia fungorum TaxID=134537 RepID=UPI0038BDBDF7
MYYYRNRYYSPQTGRFISEDPIGWASGQTNAYAYVNGNPVQLTDPAGLQWAFPITPPPVPGMGPRTGGGVPPWVQRSCQRNYVDQAAGKCLRSERTEGAR